MGEQWSPWFSWFMDLVKFVITFGITATVTLFVINRVQEKRARQESRASALFRLQLDALQEFRRAATTYEVAARSAFADLYQWKGGEKTGAMQRYEGQAFGDLNAALDGLEIRFKGSEDVTGMITKLREAHRKRHRVYDGLVDLQLDTSEVMDLWSRASNRRKQFDSLLAEAKNLRRSLVAAVEADILGGEESQPSKRSPARTDDLPTARTVADEGDGRGAAEESR